jgi:hypothetical protein
MSAQQKLRAALLVLARRLRQYDTIDSDTSSAAAFLPSQGIIQGVHQSQLL